MDGTASEHPKTGLAAAVAAYIVWGIFPLYLLFLIEVPPFELVSWRIIWTLPLCLLIVSLRRQARELIAALRNPRTMGWLFASSVLIAINWLTYVWAIQNDQVYAASLGYYINPLLNVLLGTLLLKERLSRRQWVAVALAAFGVSLLVGGALTTLWISMTLAISFGTYGLIRKQVEVGALPGLTIEALLLLVPAGFIAGYYAQSPMGSSFGQTLGLSAFLVLAGALTALPLLLFAVAARRLPYSTLGFIQFLAPSMVFIFGLTVFGEELKPAQAACFAFIWAAAAIFVWDLWKRSRKPAAT